MFFKNNKSIRDFKNIDEIDKDLVLPDDEAMSLIDELAEEHTWDITPKQLEFLEENEKEQDTEMIMFSSGYGAGKTRSLAMRLVLETLNQRSVTIFLRDTYSSLKRTSLLELVNDSDPEKAVLKPGWFSYNRTAGEILLFGGGKIILTGCDKAGDSLQGVTASCVCVDEATQIDRSEYDKIFSRLRAKGSKNLLLVANNPASESHFLYEEFFLNKDKTKKVVNATTMDNYLGDRKYPDRLIRKHINAGPFAIRRWILGEWVQNDFVVYPNFSRKENVIDSIQLSNADYYVSIDPGFVAPTAMGLFSVDKTTIFLEQEFYETGAFFEDIKKQLDIWTRLKGKRPTVIIDAAAAELVAFCRNIGYNVNICNKNIQYGLPIVRERLNKNELLGRPTLLFSDKCKNTIAEIESYSYKSSDSDVPRKKNDHSCDMLRYLCVYINDEENSVFHPFCIGGA